MKHVRLALKKTILSQMDTALHALLMQYITQLQGIAFAQMVSSLINGEYAHGNVELMNNIILLLKLVHVYLDWEESMVHVKFVPQDRLQLPMDQDVQIAKLIKSLLTMFVFVNRDLPSTQLEYAILALPYRMDF
jgi:hypothetical protein